MTPEGLILLLIFAGLFLYKAYESKKLKQQVIEKENDYKKLLSQKKSSEVRTGQISEQLAPFLSDFGHDPKKSHFLGQPIDYIIFEDEQIIFKEIKSGGAQLNSTQKKIKQLVQDKKISWEEMRIDGNKLPETSEVSGTTQSTETLS